MEKIFVVLSHTGTFTSKPLKWYMRIPYSHVSISFDRELNVLYSFGRKTLHNPFNGGFVKESKNNGLFKKCKKTVCTILEIEVEEDKYLNAKQIVEDFMNRRDLLKYNYLGLFTNFVGYPLERPNNYFCSQFVAEVLDQAGIIPINKKYSLVRPSDFINKSEFKIVYQGKLSDYKPELFNETAFQELPLLKQQTTH